MTLPALDGFAWTDGELDRRRVVQCALSRVCAVCGLPLGRPIAFLGEVAEVASNGFRLPPMHPTCAESSQTADLQVVRTGGFEFVRPGGHDADRQPRFVPNSLI